MLTVERRRTIFKLIREQGSISTGDLVKQFDVSHMTIHRDLKMLEKQDGVKRVRGGAVKVEVDALSEPHYTSKWALNKEKKEAIARYAAMKFVAAGDIVILEAGTTVAAMVKYLTPVHLTLMTNGLETINEAKALLPAATVICCGGILREPSYTFVGPEAEGFFHAVRAQTLFLGASGLTFPEGITDPNPLEIQVKRAMAASAERTVLLLDSSKFGVRSLKQVLSLSNINTLITDSGVSEAYLTQLRELGLEVYIAS